MHIPEASVNMSNANYFEAGLMQIANAHNFCIVWMALLCTTIFLTSPKMCMQFSSCDVSLEAHYAESTLLYFCMHWNRLVINTLKLKSGIHNYYKAVKNDSWKQLVQWLEIGHQLIKLGGEVRFLNFIFLSDMTDRMIY